MLLFVLSTQSLAQAQNNSITDPGQNNVALTFDDGPNPNHTEKILNILKKYKIKATFFVLGSFAERYPEIIKKIYNQGHTIANHTMSHPMLTRVNQKQLEYQILETNKIIKKITGHTPTCIRPPYGMTNHHIHKYIKSIGMVSINWDLNSFDYKKLGSNKLAHWVLKKSQPGYVILMHDGGGDRKQTIKALPIIIEGFQKRGMGFAKICEFKK